nr:hypothetical protein [Tanacetum cinerariifolium]
GTDTESEPFEDIVETKAPESPHTIAPPTLLPDSTPPTFIPILYRTVRMVVRVSHVMSPGLSASIAEVAAMPDSAFHKRFRPSYKSLPSSSSPDLTSRKHYQGMSELVEDDEGEDDEEEEEDDEEEDEEIEESLDMRRPTLTTWIDPKDGIAPYIILSPMIPLTVPSLVASPVTAETKGFLTELGARVEMQRGLIHDHMIRLEDLSPALFKRYDRDIRELFTRSGAVRDQIFS